MFLLPNRCVLVIQVVANDELISHVGLKAPTECRTYARTRP
jgi:hypothetical protein